MKKILNNKKLIPSAVALLVILGFVNSLGAIGMSGGLAQVFGNTWLSKPETRTYYVQDNNFGQQTGLTFQQNKLVAIKACSAAGGGGGGGRGNESGSNVGAGGGGGGGGGKGQCRTGKIKVRAGDTIRWLVGTGGAGGKYGEINVNLHVDAYAGFETIDTSAEDGADGGYTYVSVNGIDIMQVPGGEGGQAGTNASNHYSPGWGGAGGSLDIGLQQAWGHRGENGQNNDAQDNDMGQGGYGGNGEGQTGLLSNRGVGGSSWALEYEYGSHGGHGGDGTIASGGGGGGGGPGMWRDYIYNTSNVNMFGVDEIDSIHNRGGLGGRGGDGFVEIIY